MGGGGAPMAPSGGAPSGAAKRQSAILQPMAGGLGAALGGLDDSDYESEEEETPQQAPAPAPANANHRPLVGGFAAAAYEAARADHLARQAKKKAHSSSTKSSGSSGASGSRRPQK